MKFLIFICLPVFVASSMPPNVVLNSQMGGNDVLFDGDILLSREQLAEIQRMTTEDGRVKRQAATQEQKWPNNTVFFYFDPSIDEKRKRAVREAHEYIQSRTCINFVENPLAKNRVRVFQSDASYQDGCYSAVGMKPDGEQVMSLGKDCDDMHTAAHEFMHVLGIWHAHMRSDRDKYMTVDISQVPENLTHNWERVSPFENHLYTPYDYGSVMQYQPIWKNETMKEPMLLMNPKDPRYVRTMGSEIISFYDIEAINIHYDCHAACSASNSVQCENGGVPNPRNCSECICPLGYGGILCNERPSGCGERLNATEHWQSTEIRMGNGIVKENFSFCNHMIYAPEGKEIEVRIRNLLNAQCKYGCYYNGIEVKTDADTRITSPRICCKNFQDVVLKSAVNPTPVVTYDRFIISYNLDYRFVSRPEKAQATSTKTTRTTIQIEKETTTTAATTPESPLKTTTSKPLPKEKKECKKLDGVNCVLMMAIQVQMLGNTSPEEACRNMPNAESICPLSCGYCK